jgi:hypothetical protein
MALNQFLNNQIMPKFRKKPVVIEAIKFTGINEALQANYEQFVGQPLEVRTIGNTLCLIIPTLEGEHIASPGDMIIKGVAGECYPCKPDIFEATYEAV